MTDNEHARHPTRIVFGLILLAGVLALVCARFPIDVLTGGQRLFDVERLQTIPAWQIVVVTWLTAFASIPVVQRIARHSTGHVSAVTSLAIPAVGIALMLPLTIHMPFALFSSPAAFDEWCSLSLVIAGPALLVFALLVGVRAVQLARGRASSLSVAKIYGFTVLVSCVPFIVLFCIPPILVAVTGIPMLPLLHHMERIARADRESRVEVPFMIARSRAPVTA